MNNKVIELKVNSSKEEIFSEIKKIEKAKKVNCEFLEKSFIISSIRQGDYQIKGNFIEDDKVILNISSREGTQVLNKGILYGALVMIAPITLIAVYSDENLFLLEKVFATIFFIILFLLMPIIIKIVTYVLNFDSFKEEMNYILKKINKHCTKS